MEKFFTNKLHVRSNSESAIVRWFRGEQKTSTEI